MNNKFLCLAATILPCLMAADIARVPPAPQPDDRFKADILLIVAHPDDETEVTGYLARALYDEHRRVAVIFGTRGDGGGNAMGNEQAAALGAEREIEGRRALANFGVTNVWFLTGPDTPGQDVLRSLETWNHGASLAQAVRLIRLTRPEVILTWLPEYVAGENHGDHQAAGVIATEAFDLAGDPTAFPEQVAAPRDRYNIGNLTEGLRPWQPKKLYYFSDASHTEFQENKGPKYSTAGESPARKQPYYRMAADEMSYHLTQSDTGQAAKLAIEKGDYKYFLEPVRFIFGKSLVAGDITGDIFQNVQPGAIPFSPARPYQAPVRSGLSVELGGPWAFYRDFWRVHELKHLDQLLPGLEVSIAPGERIHAPIVIHNAGGQPAEVTLTATLPPSWKELTGTARYTVAAHDDDPLYFVIEAPANVPPGWYDIAFQATADRVSVGTIKLRVNIGPGGLPQ
jgi:LmbE family N-acetylglucosaminyl deacetylase